VTTTSPSFPATCTRPSAITTVSPTLSQPKHNTQDLATTQYSTATGTLTTTTITISPSCAQSTSLVYQPVYTCATPPALPTEWSSSLGSSLEPSAQTTCTGMNNSVLALGALLALSLVLLAVVILGWVCSCLIMRKRQTPSEQRYKTNTVSSFNHDT
jgi:hypothetical protein